MVHNLLPANPDIEFRTIGEVAKLLDVPQHVIRFWETKFKDIKPVKRKGGHRYFDKADVDLLKSIKSLLYEKGFTIKGAQKHLKEAPSDGGNAEAASIKQEKSDYPLESIIAKSELEYMPSADADQHDLFFSNEQSNSNAAKDEALKKIHFKLLDLKAYLDNQ